MPGDCPASLHILLFVCGKHSAPSRTPFRYQAKTVRLATGIGVQLQTGMLFGFTTEWRSASDRNRVHVRPDSPGRPDLVSPEQIDDFFVGENRVCSRTTATHEYDEKKCHCIDREQSRADNRTNCRRAVHRSNAAEHQKNDDHQKN